MSETEAPVVVPRVKRKYTKRKPKGSVSVKVGGKTYKGLTLETHGAVGIRLIRLDGYVWINLASGAVVEVTGVTPPTQVSISAGLATGPVFSGGVSRFSSQRNASVEALMTLPGEYES